MSRRKQGHKVKKRAKPSNQPLKGAGCKSRKSIYASLLKNRKSNKQISDVELKNILAECNKIVEENKVKEQTINLRDWSSINGKTFNHLTAIKQYSINGTDQKWLFKCNNCYNYHITYPKRVTKELEISCGCSISSKAKKKALKKEKKHKNQKRKPEIVKVKLTRKQKYHKYLKSKKWKNKRDRIISIRGHACEKCKATSNIHLHHLTYKRIFNELDEDLQLLCDSCHKEEHGLNNENLDS